MPEAQWVRLEGPQPALQERFRTQLVDRDTRAPYQETWRVPKRLSYGSHSVTARAYDSAGQSAADSVGVTRVKGSDTKAKRKRAKHRRKRSRR